MGMTAALLMGCLLTALLAAGIYEKVIRKEDLERYRIAVYLLFQGGHRQRVYSDEFYVGAGKNADVRIPAADGKIEAVHAYVYRDGEYFWIQNLSQKVPIYVKYYDETVKIYTNQKKVLRDRSIVSIGNQSFSFRRGVI